MPEREKSGLDGAGSQKAGAKEKGDSEDLSGLKSQPTLVLRKQLPHKSVNDF